LMPDGVRTRWYTVLDGRRIEVESRIRLDGEFEGRSHTLLDSGAFDDLDVEIIEGSHALGLREGEAPEVSAGTAWRAIRSPRSGCLVVSWRLEGYTKLAGTESRENLVYARAAVNTLTGRRPGATILASLHYSSPRPAKHRELLRRGRQLASWAKA